MSAERTPSEQVAHVIRLHRRGIICPSEMWRSIAYALTPTTAAATLATLAPEVRDELGGLFHGIPPAAYRQPPEVPPDEAEFAATCVEIVRWCERNFPAPPLPTEPDGLIRVRIENGRVKAWRIGEE